MTSALPLRMNVVRPGEWAPCQWGAEAFPAAPRMIPMPESRRLQNYAVAWGVLTALLGLLIAREQPLGQGLTLAAGIATLALGAVYLHFRAFDTWFKKRRYLPYLLAFVLLVGAFGLAELGFFRWVIERDRTPPGQHFINAAMLMLFATGLRYAREGIVGQYRSQEIRAARLEGELQALKTQIHPHFLFNTLNNLYALVLDKSDEAPTAVLRLAELMRYLLESSKKDRVPLRQEWDLICGVVALERLRLERDVVIELVQEGALEGLELPPMLLLPLVENAFKYGSGAETAAFSIRLELRGRRMEFRVSNGLPTHPVAPGSGTGLENLRRRLALHHPARHALTCGPQGNVYLAYLWIEL